MNSDQNNMNSGKRKLIVVGLDGGTFNVLDPLIEEGVLPNLKKIIDEGTKGELLSTTPPVTGPAWASFMTGKSPGGHSVFDFVKPLSHGYGRQIINYKHIKSKTIWSILSENGKKLGVVNVPITYPPPEVNGFLISGMLTPSIKFNYTYPASLSREIENKFGKYTLDIWWQSYGTKRTWSFLQDLKNCTEQKGKIALHLMKTREWDFFMIVFTGTDRIQHALWHLIEQKGHWKSKTAREAELRDKIKTYYHLLDRTIGEIVNEFGSKNNFILMSDHGFGPMKGKFYINRWLESKGLLTFDRSKLIKFRMKQKFGGTIKTLLKRTNIFSQRKNLSTNTALRKRAERMNVYGFLDCIDWSKTMAYAASNTEQGIYFNLKGREPSGIVKPGREVSELRDSIVKDLKNLSNSELNEKINARVHLKEEIYSGPYAENAPDIIFFLNEGEYVADVQPMGYLFERPNWKTGTGTHRMEGVLLGYGSDIKKNSQISGATIVDVAPTILTLMKVPIPCDMEGRVLEELFVDGFLNRNPARYVEPADIDHDQTIGEGIYSDEEAAEVVEKLKGLGYL